MNNHSRHRARILIGALAAAFATAAGATPAAAITPIPGAAPAEILTPQAAAIHPPPGSGAVIHGVEGYINQLLSLFFGGSCSNGGGGPGCG